MPNPKARLRDQFKEVARFRHLSFRTEESYWGWIHRFLVFHRQQAGQWRHLKTLGPGEIAPSYSSRSLRATGPNIAKRPAESQ
jgi:hypothetical protein